MPSADSPLVQATARRCACSVFVGRSVPAPGELPLGGFRSVHVRRIDVRYALLTSGCGWGGLYGGFWRCRWLSRGLRDGRRRPGRRRWFRAFRSTLRGSNLHLSGRGSVLPDPSPGRSEANERHNKNRPPLGHRVLQSPGSAARLAGVSVLRHRECLETLVVHEGRWWHERAVLLFEQPCKMQAGVVPGVRSDDLHAHSKVPAAGPARCARAGQPRRYRRHSAVGSACGPAAGTGRTSACDRRHRRNGRDCEWRKRCRFPTRAP